MASDRNSLLLAHGLERAYRMALGLETAARNRMGDADPPLAELAQWLFAAELLSILDDLRSAFLIQQAGGIDARDGESDP